MKAGPYTITQAEAIRRTKQLLASCEPKTNSQQFAHKIFEALLLAHKAGEKSPGALLAACFATDRGEDIGEPPDGYGGLGWMYPEAMIANLELSCKDIARKAEETVSLLKRRARATFEAARVFLELKARCEDLERHIHTGEVPAFAMCVIKEMRRCPKEDFVTINEIAAQPGKGALKRQAVKRAVKVSQAAKDFSVSRPTINKWERGEGKPPENFTLSDLKIYKLCLLAYEKQEQFNDAVVAGLKNGKTFSGKQMYQTRKIYRGDIGHGREADYQHPDPNEQ